MQRLTAITLGAAVIGLCGLVYDSALAQTPKTCSSRAVDIYFEKGSAALNPYSKQLVERMAHEARACGSKQVVMQVASGPARAEAVQGEFQRLGVKAILAGPAPTGPRADTIAERVVTIRLAGRPAAVG